MLRVFGKSRLPSPGLHIPDVRRSQADIARLSNPTLRGRAARDGALRDLTGLGADPAPLTCVTLPRRRSSGE